MPTIIQKIDLERGLLWLLIRVEGIVTGMRCLGESPKKVKPAFNWLERCLFIPFDSLHSLQSEMFQINSAQDREARNFTSTGVINLNTICREIFRYLKNLCKIKVVARGEGRWTRVSKDGNFSCYCSRSVISTRLSCYKSRASQRITGEKLISAKTYFF